MGSTQEGGTEGAPATQDEPPARPPNLLTAEDPRSRLVVAGLMTLDDLPLAKVFAGVTTAAVAERAGVTTGSFFHHFANAAEFVDAIAESFLDIPEDVNETIEEMNDALHHVDLVGVMRSDLDRAWRLFLADERVQMRFRCQMQLWAHSSKELAAPIEGRRTVGDVLRANYRARQAETAELWSYLLEKTGRKLLPPFTPDRFGIALSSLFQGLVIRSAVDDSVDEHMFADVVIALAAALTVPLGSRVRLADLADILIDDDRLSPQARAGARRRRETRARITASTAQLFSRGWESVSTTEVAEATGVSAQTVINLFPSTRSIAASVFARHVPDMIAIARGEARDGDDGTGDPNAGNAEPSINRADIDHLDDLEVPPHIAIERLRSTLLQLAASVTADPEPARALLSERLETTLRFGGQLIENDIRTVVPLAAPVLSSVERLDIGSTEPIDLTRCLIDFVLGHSLGRPNREAETADLAMRLLPDSALAQGRPTDAGSATADRPG